MSITVTKQSDCFFLIPEINQHLSALIKKEWFDIDYWQRQDSVKGQAVGRNITWFIGDDSDQWVLRHYYRGGLIAKFNRDKYFFSTIEKTRCFQELQLLEQMFNQQLPVPKPIAGRVIKRNGFYQADLLIEKINNTHDLVTHLQISTLPKKIWLAIGKMIAEFHSHGIYHSDLNAHNILINKDCEKEPSKLWLIDFDKCEQRHVAKSWQTKNLDRLLRSFEKEKVLHPTFYFNEESWQWLMQGYQNKCF